MCDKHEDLEFVDTIEDFLCPICYQFFGIDALQVLISINNVLCHNFSIAKRIILDTFFVKDVLKNG